MGFEIKKEGGYPALYENGKRKPPLFYQLAKCNPDHACAQKCIPQFHEAGIDVVGFMLYIKDDWHESGYDGKGLLQKISDVKRANPNAKLLIRALLLPPYWWMRQNPDELIQYYGVESVDTENINPNANKDKTNEIRVSFASKKWQKEVCEVLVKMRSIIVENGYGEDIFAIQVAYGTCGEWHMFGKYHGEGLFEGDYSLPMIAYFREYLRKKYRTNKALQRAWGNSAVTFKTAALATPAQRKTYKEVDGYLYRLPEDCMQALDSLKCLQTAAPAAISTFAKCLKEAWGKKVLVGSFYGYYFACGDVFGRMLEPHMLFEDENVDYLAGPNAYTANKWGGNAAFLRYCAESVRLNGKLFISEIDQGYKAWSCYRNVKNNNKYLCEDNAEYNAITARNVFESVMRGMGAWFFEHQHPEDYSRLDLKTGYWDDPERMACIAKIRQATEKMIANRPVFENSADVLIVYDTQSIYHFGPSLTGDLSDVHNTYNHFDMADAIAKSGVGYDMIWLYDLKKCDISKYKCVLFVACEAMRKSDYDYILGVVMGGGRTVAFMRKNGYIVDNQTDYNNMTGLYGGSALEDSYFEEQRENCRVVGIPQFEYDRNFYTRLFESAGAHIYARGGEVVTAQNNYVLVHTKGISQTVLHLACGDVTVQNEKCGTVIYDNLTGERIF